MIPTLGLSLALLTPPTLPPAQHSTSTPAVFGQDYAHMPTGSTVPIAEEVITLAAAPQTGTPAGFATLTTYPGGLWGFTGNNPVVTRLDVDRSVIWKRQWMDWFGENEGDLGRGLLQTQDGGILVSALSAATPSADLSSVLVKFDANGKLLWARCYPGRIGGTAQVVELNNGDLVLVSHVVPGGGGYTRDLAITITDPHGVPIQMLKLSGGTASEPARLSCSDLVARGQDVVLCGTVGQGPEFGQQDTFVCRISVACACALWANAYPVPNSHGDYWDNDASALHWAADGTLVVAGNVVAPSSPGKGSSAYDSYSLRLDADSGACIGAQLYPQSILSDVVEWVDPDSPQTHGDLCFLGMKDKGSNGQEHDPTLMLTDASGVPALNRLYEPGTSSSSSSLAACYQADGHPASGFFALATTTGPGSSTKAPHWIRTDSLISSGCLEDQYDQSHVPVEVVPEPLTISSEPIDGSWEFSWISVDPEIEVEVRCAGTPPSLTGSPLELSLASGGAQSFSFNAGPQPPVNFYLLMGSSSGTAPGVGVDGLVLPLNLDSLLLYTVQNANSAAYPGSFGSLLPDGTTSSTVAFNLPPALNPSLAGATLHHAYAVFHLTSSPSTPFVGFVSNAVPLTLVP